jgi:hypothetical protein
MSTDSCYHVARLSIRVRQSNVVTIERLLKTFVIASEVAVSLAVEVQRFSVDDRPDAKLGLAAE